MRRYSGLRFSRGLILGLTVILAACADPFDENVFTRVSDTAAPEVEILSPSSFSAYAETVGVSAVLSDGDEVDLPSRLASVAYSVTGTLGVISENAVDISGIGEDGSIAFDVPLEPHTFAGDIVITLTAADWNGNSGSASVTLVDPGSDIPSFVVTPSNKSVTLAWNEVSGATSYSIYYTGNGSLPSDSYGNQINDLEGPYTADSPYTISGLENGRLHVFQLAAHGESTTWTSDYVEVLPLSPFSLAPQTLSRKGGVGLSWTAADGIEDYVVWRGSTREGSFTNISGDVSGTQFLDANVPPGDYFFYRVTPSTSEEIRSAPIAGYSSVFADKRFAPVSSIDGSKVWSIAAAGDYVVSVGGDGADAVHVFSHRGNAELELITTLSIAGAQQVAMEGQYAYVLANSVGEANDGIAVIRITGSSASDISIEQIKTGIVENPSHIAVGDGYAYVSQYAGGPPTDGLQVLDLSDPSDPVKPAGGSSGFVAISGVNGQLMGLDVHTGKSEVYIANRSTDKLVRRIDVSTPASPVLLPDLAPMFYDPQDVLVDEGRNLLYVADRSSGLRVVDISDSSSASILGTADTSDAWALGRLGDIVSVADRQDGVRFVSTSMPNQPFIIEKLPSLNAFDVRIHQGAVFVADWNGGTRAAEISLPLNSSIVATTGFGGRGYNIHVEGDRAYVLDDWTGSADPTAGVFIFDISDPESPALLGTVPSNDPISVELAGDRLFVGNASSLDSDPEVVIYDISNPAAPQTLGSFPVVDRPYHMDLYGDLLYVVDYGRGLKIVDVADPAEPQLLGELDSLQSYRAIRYGEFVLMADDENGVLIIDVSDPTNPRLRRAVDVDGGGNARVLDIGVRGGYVFAVTDARRLYTFPLRNIPSIGTADVIDHSALGTLGSRIEIGHTLAVITSPNIITLDIRDPEQPVVLQRISATTPLWAAIAGGYALVADYDDGLLTVNISP
jgi:hypothetical protein